MTAQVQIKSVQKEAANGENKEVSSQPELTNQEVSFEEKRLPFAFAKKYGVLFQMQEDGHVRVFHKKGLTPVIAAELRRYTASSMSYELVDEDRFGELLSVSYQSDSGALQNVAGIGDDMDLASLADQVPESEDLLEQADDAPIIRLINAILSEGIKEETSDIHIETFEKHLAVRFRVDGVLQEKLRLKRQLAPLLTSRIKVMSKLDIAEKRVPQDGRIALRVAGKEVDVRVSTLPSNSGERIVMRLLDKSAGRLNLTHLGMSADDMQLMKTVLSRPHGIILVTGPTGSGKTTSLYASLSTLNDQTRNILTVEDPIEYNLEGIGQTQVNTKVDMTFARGLRAILRQDPDVVMVGEIRDTETAEIAVQASLTGHLVLSTLHTNSAVGAITRLQDMGVEPFLLSSSLVGVVAQRLVRRLCQNCKEPYRPDEAECLRLHLNVDVPPEIYRAKGCAECNYTGYKGRNGIYEIIPVDSEVRRFIHNQAGEQEIIEYIRISRPSIREDGRRKVLAGLTTLEEVLRVTQED
ncbi:type II secretion system ATPase GspE [Zooshikella harenae]|uniref:Type II secretion system protein E n=1 Tax=Zooshikella harenae TaxID=2827238 RepID=A0ABS5Z7A8_9GAMM|nr:type II secretion system ATPase GspE [Zooshikella harenae]MBU2709943.1 type II secretion system ATPase GspE [Zooshikella harenae]